jgi:hypothetical protein
MVLFFVEVCVQQPQIFARQRPVPAYGNILIIQEKYMSLKKRILLLSTMRDEGPYILEWLAYHRSLGFTDFLIYTNDCRDGTDLMLDRLEANGVLTHVRNKVLKRGPQKSAYKAAMAHPLFAEADWVMASDVDEFLVVNTGAGRLEDLLQLHPSVDAIPVCWRMFSHNGKEGFIDGLTTEVLVDAESPEPRPNDVGHFVKSLFKPHPELKRIGTHAPVYSDEYAPKASYGASWYGAGKSDKPDRPKTDYGYHVAQINHYAVRSVDPFLVKCDRGDGNYMENRLHADYWKRWCRGGTTDTSIQRIVPEMKKEMYALMEDPIVRHLHEGSIEYHKTKIADLLQLPEYRQLKAEIMGISPASVSVPAAETPAAQQVAAPTTMNSAAAELPIKAPKRHQNRLLLLEALPKNGKGAEIGVWNGGFSGYILEVTQPTELVLIDPWDLLAGQDPGDWTHKKHSEAEEMRTMRHNVESMYGDLPNVNIKQGFSAEVLAMYPDNYFDWVYIDGNHLYDFVKKDLELSFKKVRPGGIVAGDDFFWKRNDRMHVKEAVLDTMRSLGMQNRPTRHGQQFMITVPE